MVYTNTLSMVRTAGIGVQVENELLGTGDSVNESYDTASENIIADSYTLKYGTASTEADTNDLTDLTETTHYTITKDSGVVLLTASGVSTLGTNALYISYTHSPKASDTVLASSLPAATKEVEKMTSNYWGTEKTTVETFDWDSESDYPTTDEPYIRDYDPPEELQLNYRGITGITSIKTIAPDGTYDRTLDSSTYRFTAEGRVILYTTLPNGYDNIEVTYTHGYASVPADAQELTDLVIALRTFAAITGGSYDDATVFSLGRKSVSIGEVYVNVREATNQFQNRIKQLLPGIGQTLHAC